MAEKRTKPKWRKWACALAMLLTLFLLALLALPLWLPWVLGPAAKTFGLRYKSLERAGYGSFVLHEARFTNENVTITAERIRTFMPANYIWRLARDKHQKPFLSVTNWTVRTISDGRESTNETTAFMVAKKLEPMVEALREWVPRATLSDGEISAGTQIIRIAQVTWDNPVLRGELAIPDLAPTTIATVDFSNRSTRLSFQIDELAMETKATLERTPESLSIKGQTVWLTNQVDWSAAFRPQDLLPHVASIESAAFRVPSEWLKLEGYDDVSGSVRGVWSTNAFTLSLSALAAPNENEQVQLSPITAEVEARGDTNSIHVEKARVFSPWLEAHISRPIELSFRGRMLSPAASLTMQGDLSRQKWLPATGEVAGELFLRPSTNRYPGASFSARGEGVGVGKFQSEQIAIEGDLAWPWLEIGTLSAELPDGGRADGKLRFNAVTHTVAEGEITATGKIAAEFLPAFVAYDGLTLTASLAGPLTNLAHRGSVTVEGVRLPRLAPTSLELNWVGEHLSFTEFTSKLLADDSSITASGSVSFSTNAARASLTEVHWIADGKPALSSTAGFTLEWEKGSEATKANFRMTPMDLANESSAVALSGEVLWPDQGQAALRAENLTSLALADFIAPPVPAVRLESAMVLAGWTNGPVHFAWESRTSFASRDGSDFLVQLEGSGDGEGITLASATVSHAFQQIVAGKGTLPVRLVPGASSNTVEILPQGAFNFEAATTTNEVFWAQVERWTGLRLESPRVDLNVRGSLREPTGKLSARASEIVFAASTNGLPMPRVQNLDINIGLARDRIELREFAFLVEGQPVTANGSLPLPEKLNGAWKDIFDWRKADLHVQMEDAQIAPFERLFPEVLSPMGSVDVDITARDGNLSGGMTIRGISLRPIPSIGPVHDIEGSIALEGRRVEVETLTATIGGQTVAAQGEMELREFKGDALPPFQLHFRGTNVPLARKPELILRSDIDLTVANTNGGEPVVSGTMQLRDSFYLSDVKQLIPGKVAKPSQRPPYFSIEQAPFSQWRLNVQVRGKDFFKVRSPLFRGELSANLKVTGPLGEPVALGDATIESGVIQFPFANLRVEQGFVTLTSENPYRPQISLTAAARTFGYEVRMEVSGPADKPTVEFSSNPGLTSEQILLMITAGELPRDELTFSTQQKASRLAFFLGKSLYSKFGGSSESKLEIRSGDDISDDGKETYYLEYKLTDDWSIVGEYDRYGGVNAGVKWIFFSK